MTEEKEIQEYKDLLSEKILSIIPEQTDPAQLIDELIGTNSRGLTLRISQIDIIDILSEPKLDVPKIKVLLQEYDIHPHEKRKRRNHKEIEERLKPYGISKRLWEQFHDEGYDAFDFPLVPKRSLSIPIDNGVSGAWAPNGYGKTFVFARILKTLQETKALEFGERAMNTHELFTDFLRKCTALLRHSNKSTIPLPYDAQREKKTEKRLIPFRQICFSVEALENNHATEFFSIRIEVEYDVTGNVSDYSLHLLAPNVANLIVVEGNIKLPNWINSNFHLEQISHDTLMSEDHYTKWPIAALEKLLSLNVNYIEIPSLAYQPNAGEFVQENIKMIVSNLLDEFTSVIYPDIEIDKHGLLAVFSKEGGDRFLLVALKELYNDLKKEEIIEATDNSHRNTICREDLLLHIMKSHGIEDRAGFLAHARAFGSNRGYLKKAELETALEAWNANDSEKEITEEEDDKISVPPIHGTGTYALHTLIANIQTIESEINALVNNDNDGWGIELRILSPNGKKALDIMDKSSGNILPWGKLSFGQRNDLILQTTLAQYQHCYNTSNTEEQVVLVIDEPEAGRSESWVNQLMHKLSTHISTHPILILSHRGMVLESINSSGEYQIMHTVQPDIDEVDEETYKDYGTLQSKLSTKAKQSFVLINAFVDHPDSQEGMSRWRVNFPKTITPSEEWMETKAVENQWILKPTNITESEYINIKQFVNQAEGNHVLSNQELLLILWDGRIWPSNLKYKLLMWPVTKTPKYGDVFDHLDERPETLVKGIHRGGLGLPQTIKLNFLLTHLPTSYPKSPKEESKTYHNKTIKELALTNGLKISNSRISNVRKTIALAEQQEDGADLFATNLNNFIAGLKVRLASLQGGNPKMPTKNALETYILQLENQLTKNPLITQLESQDEINARQPATGPNQQFTEQGFFGYLKTLGVKMPEQITQENPTSITDFEETTLTDPITPSDKFNQMKKFQEEIKSLYADIIITDPPYKTGKDFGMLSEEAMDKVAKKFSFHDVKQYRLHSKVAKVALRLRDKEKHPTQANFDTTKYRWTQKTLIASIIEAEINDYAEELVLHLASRYADENDLDPEEKIWIRADAFKKAAREIADRDESSRFYDDFDDECGQYMLIRADIHGYSCLTCENMYDEKKFLI